MDSAQRISVVLEFDDNENDWAVVAMLINGRGARRRTTLARYPSRSEASALLDSIFGTLPIQTSDRK